MKPPAPETLFTEATASLLRLREETTGERVHGLVADFLDHMYEIGVSCGGADLHQSPQLHAFVQTTIADVMTVFVCFAAYPGELLRKYRYTWQFDEWQQLCRRRSGLQFFLDTYRATSVAPIIETIDTETAYLDEHMREWGAREGFLSAAAIDPRIPPSHWWWWAPQAPDAATPGKA